MRIGRSVYWLIVATMGLLSLPASGVGAQPPDYTLFEAGQVRPLAMSPDGNRLYAVNTPDGYLEVYDILAGGLARVTAVPVGLEPVAVAARTNDEVWVVNHLSDSISVVDVAATPLRVVRTLLVGDEPRDIVFAGPGGNRAFITAAHRGQNSPYPDGDFDVEGIGRADVWVFDATDLGTSLGGTPLTIVTLFGDKPRALAATPDGSTVYAAVFRSGNLTTTVGEGLVCDGSGPCNVLGTQYPGGLPLPDTNFQGTLSREAGLIVGINPATGDWEDELGRNWNNAVRFSLPDLDVFEIDADANPPVETNSISDVGTILFNMIVNPANGNLYVTNTEANNRVRFEGMGNYVSTLGPKPSGDPPSVRGHLHEARITVIDTSSNVFPRHLNKHIDYLANPQPLDVKDRSLATPLGLAISSDGSTLYVAGFGSSAVGVYDTAQLENDTFVPDAANMVSTNRGGPSGLVLDEARGRLYVLTRFSNRIEVFDTSPLGFLIQLQSMHNPEPPSVTRGRAILYDAKVTSSNGEASCSSCHVFGDMDDLAWDLGDPDGVPVPNPNPSPVAVDFPPINTLQPFDTNKGPMTSQSLRGLATTGPMHWRGDRTGGPLGDPLDEDAAFNAFNVAFPGLVGRDEGELDPAQMQQFTDFALRLTYPPNPIRNLDNSLRAEEQAGMTLFSGRITDTVANCQGCHEHDRAQGFFGTGGGSTFENETMEFKVPHLRNAYQKVGMFGMAPSGFFSGVDGSPTGDQIRGFGFLHDGSVDTVFDFSAANVFDANDTEQRNLEAAIMAFDTDLAPIVGQQVTLSDTSGPDVNARVDLLLQRAAAPFVMPNVGTVTECDLIVKGVVSSEARGWVRQSDGTFLPDKSEEAPITASALRALASVPGQPLTFSCVPPGSGTRMGINRDRDGLLDGDDSVPFAPPPPPSFCSAGAGAWGSGSDSLIVVFLGFVALHRRRRRSGRTRR
jgi:DNA-binding beta-propeller fold protein YncE